MRIEQGKPPAPGRCAALLATLIVAGSLSTTAAESAGDDLTALSLEELMQIEVTSVSKKGEPLFEVAAAVYVVTQDDIRRSGATTIPEALRQVPGLEVARIDGNKWAVTSRGFNERFANKLLVLIDGRSVYEPLFAGIFWEAQDVMLEDVQRIEVVRGPGAALWGANAVNGIINLITKHSSETQGGRVTLGSGTEETGVVNVRYGAPLKSAGHYRVYAKYFRHDSLEFPSGVESADRSKGLRTGFRADWTASDSDRLTVQGDHYDGEAGQTYTIVDSVAPPFFRTFDFDTEVSGSNFLGRWTRAGSDSSELALQFYYDRTQRDDAFGVEKRDTIDLDFQRRQRLGNRHDVVWGAGYRRSRDRIAGSFVVSADPPNRIDDLFNLFIHDAITLKPDRLQVTLGTKVEHNDYTGYEIQPNARMLWKPNALHSTWAAISRSVRTPSRAEHDIRFILDALPPDALFPGSPSTLIVFEPNEDFESEELVAYEAGYRFAWSDSVSVDLAAYFNVYDSLHSTEPGATFPELLPAPPHLVLPMRPENLLQGETYGYELAVDWRPVPRWRVKTAYSSLKMDLESEPTSMSTQEAVIEGRSPRWHWHLRSSVDLPREVKFDVIIRGVDELPSLGLDGYESIDARLGWTTSRGIELALVGKNLADSDHLEFVSTFLNTAPTVARRSVYGTVTWKF